MVFTNQFVPLWGSK
ncbi:unnamed protein product, partial [Allacma fusca]